MSDNSEILYSKKATDKLLDGYKDGEVTAIKAFADTMVSDYTSRSVEQPSGKPEFHLVQRDTDIDGKLHEQALSKGKNIPVISQGKMLNRFYAHQGIKINGTGGTENKKWRAAAQYAMQKVANAMAEGGQSMILSQHKSNSSGARMIEAVEKAGYKTEAHIPEKRRSAQNTINQPSSGVLERSPIQEFLRTRGQDTITFKSNPLPSQFNRESQQAVQALPTHMIPKVQPAGFQRRL